MLLIEDQRMSDVFRSSSASADLPTLSADIFSPSASSDDLYIYPVDGQAAMCLEVLQTDQDVDAVRFHDFTPHERTRRASYQSHPGTHPDSPSSGTDFGGVRSPGSVCSDGGKPYKPQYTAELEVLCRICGDRASGFHYGVHSCEGCKGFFRRTLKKQLVYKPCQAGSRCKIDTGTRNKCQYCRYQRCLFAGMSQDAVRFGRMPKVEREKLLADREELTCTSSRRIVELRSLTDLIKAAFRDTFNNTIFFTPSPTKKLSSPPTPSQPLQYPLKVPSLNPLQFMPPTSPTSPTLAATDDFVNHMLSSAEVLDSLTTEQFFSRGIFHRFQQLTLPVMEGSVRFAKKIPGFTSLSMRDQILLMKRNGFMVVHLALYSLISPNYVQLDTEDSLLRIRRDSYFVCEQMTRLLGHVMSVMDRVHSVNLTIGELALFSAVLLTQDCPGLACPQQVEELQGNLIEALRIELKHNHPKEKVLLAKMLLLVPDLSQIVEDFSENLRNHVFDPSREFANVMPLLKEIFDLDPDTPSCASASSSMSSSSSFSSSTSSRPVSSSSSSSSISSHPSAPDHRMTVIKMSPPHSP